MKVRSRVLLIFLIVSVGYFLAGRAHGQSARVPLPVKTGRFNCSPAPCVLPPTKPPRVAAS